MRFDFETKTLTLTVDDREALGVEKELYFSDEVAELYFSVVHKDAKLAGLAERVNSDRIGRTGEMRATFESQARVGRLVKDLHTVTAHLHPEWFPEFPQIAT